MKTLCLLLIYYDRFNSKLLYLFFDMCTRRIDVNFKSVTIKIVSCIMNQLWINVFDRRYDNVLLCRFGKLFTCIVFANKLCLHKTFLVTTKTSNQFNKWYINLIKQNLTKWFIKLFFSKGKVPECGFGVHQIG